MPSEFAYGHEGFSGGWRNGRIDVQEPAFALLPKAKPAGQRPGGGDHGDARGISAAAEKSDPGREMGNTGDPEAASGASEVLSELVTEALGGLEIGFYFDHACQADRGGGVGGAGDDEQVHVCAFCEHAGW